MKTLATEGIVLRRAEYRDSDRMLTIISPSMGSVAIMAKGIRRPNAKLRAASEILTYGNFELTETNDRYTLTGFTLIDAFSRIRTDITTLSHASYILALSASTIGENLSCEALFDTLRQTLSLYNELTINPVLISLQFLLHFAYDQGVFPELFRCAVCGKTDDLDYTRSNSTPFSSFSSFSLVDGGICHKSCSNKAVSINSDTLRSLREFKLNGDIGDISVEQASLTFNLMRAYVREQLSLNLKAEKALDSL